MDTAVASLAGRARRGAVWLIAATLAIAAAPAPAASPDIRRLDAGLPASGQWRNGFGLVDLDGDGRLDLVHGPRRKGDGKPQLFRGLGGGRFEPCSGARFPNVELDYGDAVAADFDGDGAIDLAFAAHFRGLTAWRGVGQGRFEPWASRPASAGPTESGAAHTAVPESAEPGGSRLGDPALSAGTELDNVDEEEQKPEGGTNRAADSEPAPETTDA